VGREGPGGYTSVSVECGRFVTLSAVGLSDDKG